MVNAIMNVVHGTGRCILQPAFPIPRVLAASFVSHTLVLRFCVQYIIPSRKKYTFEWILPEKLVAMNNFHSNTVQISFYQCVEDPFHLRQL
jgi:hypothetical protein